jgi:hypothetical protein
MMYLVLYIIAGIIFDIWIQCQIGGWKASRMGRFGWILGLFLWPIFLIGEFIDWLLSFSDNKHNGGIDDD